MIPDNRAAAPVARQSQEFREEPGGEQTGVAPQAAVGKRGDGIGMFPPKRHQRGNAFPPQQRLIGNLKENAVAVRQRVQPQLNRIADPQFRMFIPQRNKVERFCRL